MAILAEPTQPSERTLPTPARRAGGGLVGWVRRHREFASALVFMLLMFLAFAITSPGVFLKPQIYNAIFVSVPISMILASSDIHTLLVGRIGSVPVQLVWGLVFAAIGVVLFTRHRFGAQVACVGDNIEAAREMGINVRRVKTLVFAYVGLASGFAGVLSILINNNFFPTVGDGYLLGVLAAVFVGGTPTWGGVGTVAGSVVGALTVGSIETGIVAAGLTGYFTQFFDGIVIVLSLVTHRITRPRTRVGRG